MSLCPHCGQSMPTMRLGRKLSPLKARIFDLINRAGIDGISGDELFWIVFRDQRERHPGVKRTVLKVHVKQINDALAGTGFYIRGCPGRTSYYVLRQRKQQREAA